MKDIYEPLNFSSHLALGWQILNNMKLTAGWVQYKQYDGQVNYYDTFITFNNYNRLHNRKLTVLLNRDRNPTTYTKDSENFVIGLHSSLFGLQIDANTWYRSSSVSLYADYFYEELNYHYSQIDGIVYAAGFDISLRKQYGIYQGQLSYTRSSLKTLFSRKHPLHPQCLWAFAHR